MKRRTTEEFISAARKVHGYKYLYDKVAYTLIKNQIIITCKKHGDFEQRAGDHLSGYGCKKCGVESAKNKLSTDYSSFVVRAASVHGGAYKYPKRVTGFSLKVSEVPIECQKHGRFYQKAGKHLSGDGCPECGKERSVNKRRMVKSEFLERAKAVHGDKYGYGLVILGGWDVKITIVCPSHGEFKQTMGSHLWGNGCPECGSESSKLARRLSTKDFITKAKGKHGGKYKYTKVKYTDWGGKVIITCKKHGDFEQRAGDHLSGYGCKKCSNDAVSAARAERRLSAEEYAAAARKVHGGKYLYSGVTDETTRSGVYTTITCKRHGKFRQDAYYHLQGGGCPQCSGKGFSDKAIAWIEKEAFSRRMKSVQHARNLGEFKIPNTRYRADGYHKASNTIFEFHGDAFHGNPKVYDPEDTPNFFNRKLTAKQLYAKTKRKERDLLKLGYRLIVIWESDYNKGLPAKVMLPKDA